MDNIERVIILSQSERHWLLPLLTESIDELDRKIFFSTFRSSSLKDIRAAYKSVLSKIEEAFNV